MAVSPRRSAEAGAPSVARKLLNRPMPTRATFSRPQATDGTGFRRGHVGSPSKTVESG
jgi:hypothetical protein